MAKTKKPIENEVPEVAPEKTDAILIQITPEGILVGEEIQKVESVNLKDLPMGAILVITHYAFITPQGAAEFLADKLAQNPNFSILGIAPAKANALFYDKETNIAHYPAVSGACVAIVNHGQDIALNYHYPQAFFIALATNRARGTQTGYTTMEGAGYVQNPAIKTTNSTPCPTC